MSDRSSRSLRLHALAIATATALSATVVFAPAHAAGPGRVNLAGLQSAGQHDRFIVKYREGAAERANPAALRRSLNAAAQATLHGKALGLHKLRSTATGATVLKTDRKLGPGEAEALMRRLAADPDVAYVEVDRLMKPIMTPNDTYYSDYQWDYYEPTGGINADDAWNVTDGAGVVVAVIDTGITSHSDLNANILPGYDFISDAGMARDGGGRDSNPADQGDWWSNSECGPNAPPSSNSSWHGTHVAGTVAAITNNSSGVAGVAHGAKVVPVRVLGKCGGYTSDIVDGIVWAAGGSVSGVPSNPNPAEVINMSLGGGGACSASYQNAIDFAVSQGTTVVVAAGNSNDYTAGYTPASCDNVVAVASTTRQGTRSGFSNYGTLIDVAAPGSDIASTVNSGSTTPSTEGYSLMSGTSMASPHVAGVAALMQAAAGGGLTPAQVESNLKSTLRAFPSSPDRDIGDGIVDAAAAVAAVSDGGGDDGGGGGGDSVLDKGVAETNLSAGTGSDIVYTFQVPAGATDLSFATSGGSGDADLYVRHGSAPTDSSYDCRPYRAGNAETCSFASPASGTWYVRVKAYSAFSGLSLVADYTAGGGSDGGGGGSQTYTNSNDYAIRDRSSSSSWIDVSGRSGNAPASTRVDVDIRHSYRGDLDVDLVAPDGSVYRIKSANGGDSADNVIGYATLDLSSESINGRWSLKVTDHWRGDTGYINSWSITF